ncbi:glycogen/starch synthase [Ignisphaera sp. 4213-co]|uniref:Glycogen/starch synthase n=1 Tax=Ignisphaera cupida TaxID=3050454 RepID=A0ABD4Z6S7_9CREN|nr:glycogen/starch synthase [Ignisphaera sp. 4213-co]MDK6029041.1 glycogen/starch synthase [Ignisphaera sp. 4213-co]
MIVAPTKINNVWLLTFEFGGLASLGGLGRAVTLYAKVLKKLGYNVKVFMPSHGRHLSEEHRRIYSIKPIDWFKVCRARRGLDGNEYRYCIGAEEAIVDGIKVVMFKGLDIQTGRFLDNWHIYAHSEEKACLFARGLQHWIEITGEVPDVIHANDWSTALAGVAAKIIFEARGYAIPLVYSIHLLSYKAFPWHYASCEWCGVPDICHRIWIPNKHIHICTQRLWDSLKGEIDAFTSIEADVMATNSWGYLRELLSRFGFWLEEKSFVIHNITDWKEEEASSYSLALFKTTSRKIVREIIINEWANKLNIAKIGYLGTKCKYLVSAAGRLTSTKGFDILLKSLEHTSKDVCVAIFGLPIGDSSYEHYLATLVGEEWGRAILFTQPVDEKILKTVIFASNAFVVPSRYEPFGIVSIEAQAVGTPSIVSNVGGLPETVIDLKWDFANGTGVVVPSENPYIFGEAINDVVMLTEFIDTGDRSNLDKVRSEWGRKVVERIGNINIRLNCVNWVNRNFREDKLAELLQLCYEKARQYSYFRAVTM